VHLYASFLDPYLNHWDECFHALVAKNMLDFPFTPMLHREPALPLSDNWAQNHVWLHKPPVFLWLMSLSMKIFGTTVWAVRLPSALLLSLLAPILLRMGTLIHSRPAGVISALLSIFCYYLFDLGNGTIATDHNDAAFIPLVCASFWAWLEYQENPQRKWLRAIGVFAGLAVLTKLYLGFLIFLPWGLLILSKKMNGLSDLLKAFGICIVVVSFWIVPASIRFPDLALHEWVFKASHVDQAVDGHEGTALFHLAVIAKYLKPFHWTTILLAVLCSLYFIKRRHSRILIVSSIVFVHGLFMVAQTKMESYTMILLPIYLISVATTLVALAEALPDRIRTGVLALAVILLCAFGINKDRINKRHYDRLGEYAPWRAKNMEMLSMFERIVEQLQPNEQAVVFNIEGPYNVQFMFHHGYEAMAFKPRQEDVDRLSRIGYRIYVLINSTDSKELRGVTYLDMESDLKNQELSSTTIFVHHH